MPRRHDLELFLKQSEIFRHLSAEERCRLAESSRERSFARREILFHEGRPSDFVWLAIEGRVHLIHHQADGRVEGSCVMTPGETFCCLPALDRGVYPATAIAATPARALQIPMDLFHQMIRGSPAFLQETLCLFGGRLRQLESKICMVHDPVECRIAQALIALQRKFKETIPLTRHEVAELAGTTVETAIRTLRRFEKQGWVRSSRGKIRLLRPDSMRQILG